jgi:transcriptional regulator GlxA family with amidase domain
LPWRHVLSFPIPRTERIALDRMVNRLWNHPVSGALMIGPILGVIAEMLHAQQRRSFDTTIKKSWHQQTILRRSDDYLSGHLAIPFQLEALANASGTTVRTLQRIFCDAYGVTPHEWARCLALHRARQHLQSPAARKFTVEGIAQECGFRHMGRFSAYYEELFGEFPSTTLAGSHRVH